MLFRSQGQLIDSLIHQRDCRLILREESLEAKEIGLVHIEIIGALTKGQRGEELAELGDMSETGAVAFSDDDHYIRSAKVMLNGMDYLKNFNKIIIDHNEEISLVEEGVMNDDSLYRGSSPSTSIIDTLHLPFSICPT